MKFSDFLWREIAPIYQQILKHPFNLELAAGTLDRKRFIYYLEQDAYFLLGFSRAAALIAGRSGSSKIIQHFLNFSLEMLTAELELHAKFLNLRDTLDTIEPSLASLAYVQYVIATAATAPLEVAIAAMLPCPWIYNEVGLHIALRTSKNNPYQDWIDAYSSEDFSDETKQTICLLDEIASQCTENTLAQMRKAFETTSRLEWHFWNDAYEMRRL